LTGRPALSKEGSWGEILRNPDPDGWRDIVQAVGNEIQVAVLSGGEGIAADPASSVFDDISSTVADPLPGAAIVPFMLSGGNDAGNSPNATVYGVVPCHHRAGGR
jgi:hypothetical protein